MSDELQKYRGRIDEIDEAILELMNERGEMARAIGHLKQGGVIYRPEREAQVLRRIQQLNPGPLSQDAVTRLFREIMSACLALEKPLSVSFLGPAGTFSEQAAVKHFGQAALLSAGHSIDDVLHQVEAGGTDYAVVPVENSTEGAVGRTLDLLVQTSLKICGEVALPIHHFLLSQAAEAAAVRRVYSHVQSLGQCQEWLNHHLPQAERISVSSNAEAARLAAQDPGAAAIAGEQAAPIYSLGVLAQHIEDVAGNTTRFLVLGRHDAQPSGRDKTSLVMSAANRPGAMHDLLEPLARHGVSMTKLESRPSKLSLWEYVFFLDIQGHSQDPDVALALAEIRTRAAFVKILGSYPVAVY